MKYSCTCPNSYAAGELAMNSKQLCDKSQVNSNHESARTISFTVKTLMRPLHTRNVSCIRILFLFYYYCGIVYFLGGKVLVLLSYSFKEGIRGCCTRGRRKVLGAQENVVGLDAAPHQGPASGYTLCNRGVQPGCTPRSWSMSPCRTSTTVDGRGGWQTQQT